MTIYNIDETFDRLKALKITTNKESVRRWLRQGVIKGFAPSSRKEGWKISKEALDKFIQQRLPDEQAFVSVNKINETNVVKEIENRVRAEMWYELARKNIWQGFVEIKKSRLRECIKHRRYSKQLEDKVWERCIANSSAYSKPRVFFLLEAFGFEGQRVLLDQNFEDLEEQVLFSIIEYIRANPSPTVK